MHRNHFSAHCSFVDLATFIRGIPVSHRTIEVSGNHIPLPEFPIEETLAQVA